VVVITTDQLPAKTRQRREDLEQGFPRVLFGEAVSGQENRSWGLSASNTTRTVGCPHPTGGGNTIPKDCVLYKGMRTLSSSPKAVGRNIISTSKLPYSMAAD